MEAVNRFEGVVLNTAQETVGYVKEVDSPAVGVLLDTYHMNIEEFSIGGAIRTAGDIYYENGKDYWGFQHIRQIADFYDAVENDREPFISGKQALKIQKLICDIYEKGREGWRKN